MLSSSQIRAARALLGWSGIDLAEKSAVGITTLRRYELQKGIPSANTSVLLTLKETLENYFAYILPLQYRLQPVNSHAATTLQTM